MRRGRAVTAVAGHKAATRLLLVGHDAFTAGSQLLLLHVGRALVERGVAVSFLLLGGGRLESEYRAVAPTVLFAGAEELGRHAAALAASGFRAAIVKHVGPVGRLVRRCRHTGSRARCCCMRCRDCCGSGSWSRRQRPGWAQRATWCSRQSSCGTGIMKPSRCRRSGTVILPQGLYRPVERASDAAAALLEPAGRAARRARLRLPDGATLAVGLGYADLRKGFDLFLQVWRLAQAADASIHLLWVGDIDPTIFGVFGSGDRGRGGDRNLP